MAIATVTQNSTGSSSDNNNRIWVTDSVALMVPKYTKPAMMMLCQKVRNTTALMHMNFIPGL